MRFRASRRPVFLSMLSILAMLLALATEVLAGQKSAPQHGEVQPGSALVTFVRTGRFAGGGRTMFLFADDQFLGVLDNGTYSFAQVPPGKHLFWTNWTRVTKELDLIPGRAYYLDCWAAISVVDEAAGKALVEQVRDFVTPTPKEQETAARYVRERHGKAQTREAKKDKADVPDVLAPVVPETDREGRILLPAWSELRLELLEGITSAHDATGDDVAFEVAADVVVESATLIRAGTPVRGVIRQAAEGKAGGVGGVLDVAVPSVTADDGSPVPVAGLVAEGGRDRTKAASGAAIGFGIFGALAVQGREAHHLRGEVITVATREDAWLRPVAEGARDAAPAAAPADVTLAAPVPAAVEIVPAKAQKVQEVGIVLTTDSLPTAAAIATVAGRPVLRPVRASRIEAVADGARCEFDGWVVARLLRPDASPGDNRVEIRGTLADGRSFAAFVELELRVREPH